MPQRVIAFLQSFGGKRFVITEISLFIMTLLDTLDIWIKIFSGIAAIVVAYFAIRNYQEKTALTRTENKLKMLELEKKEQEWWEEQEKKKQIKSA